MRACTFVQRFFEQEFCMSFMVEPIKRTKGRGKRQLVETLHSVRQVKQRIKRGEDTQTLREVRKLLVGQARAHLRAVNFGRKRQGLPLMTWKELFFSSGSATGVLISEKNSKNSFSRLKNSFCPKKCDIFNRA